MKDFGITIKSLVVPDVFGWPEGVSGLSALNFRAKVLSLHPAGSISLE